MTLSDQVSSALFVGREAELQYIQELLTPPVTSQVLHVYTDGDGGVGKTKLLLHIQEYCRSCSDSIMVASDLIDFYHTESRSKLAVMRQIAEYLGNAHFPEFSTLCAAYFAASGSTERERMLPQIESAFYADYEALASQAEQHGQFIVILFDTYECIQGTEFHTDEGSYVQGTGFSHWLETELFPALLHNTLLVISGRYQLTEADAGRLNIEYLQLAPFSVDETKTFWAQCFDSASSVNLSAQSESEQFIHTLHDLADGRPILLALFADWLNYTHNPRSPEHLFQEIETTTGMSLTSVTAEHRALFEKTLIERFASFRHPEERAIIYLAISHRRTTPAMFHALTTLPEETCQHILLEQLQPLSFIKYKKGQIVLLHDEMRRLILQHWWEAQDAAKEDRRAIAHDLLKYYTQHLLAAESLSEIERETYTSEMLGYAFLAEPAEGLQQFCREYDLALEDGKYDYCDLLLREAEDYHADNPHDLPFPDFLEIALRRIRYNTTTARDYESALHAAQTIVQHYSALSGWQESVIYGHVLMEMAVAQFSLQQFETAIKTFRQAHGVFYLVGEDSSACWANNWVGYTYYRQGKFAEAKDFLLRAWDDFQDIIEEQGRLNNKTTRRLLQGLQMVLGNLAMVYNHLGDFEEAIRLAEMTLDIVRNLPYNDLEIARTRNTAGYVFAFAGHAIDARHHLTEADTLLRDMWDRQIIGRVKTNLGFLHYRVNEFSYLLEYYRAEDIEKSISHLPAEHIDAAREFVEEAIEILETEPVIAKELADAYYALGELYVVTPSEEHWERAEQAFLQSLTWGRESQFLYRTVDTLESLVTLYYFWNGSSDITSSRREENRRKMAIYQEEMKSFSPGQYPNLFGKYTITLGDMAFDEALELLYLGSGNSVEAATPHLLAAFGHYIEAARLMKGFNEKRYYLSLRVCYDRLNTLLDESRLRRETVEEMITCLDAHRAAWQKRIPEFQQIFDYVAVRIKPEEALRTQTDALQTSIQKQLDQGQFGLALLLNDCLIGICLALLTHDNDNDAYHEYLVLRMHVQYKLYRILGDEYQARRYLRLARRKLQAVRDPHVKEALDGWADAGEGTLKYRRGGYGKLLEFYLEDELDTARSKFDAEFPGERQQALELLQRGEEKLRRALTFWEEQEALPHPPEDQERLVMRLNTYRKHLGETQFRIGELLMLHEHFKESSYQKRVFRYLKQAISSVETSGARYRHDDALQSYINALYFSGNYHNPDYQEEHLAYERQLEEKLSSSTHIYPSIMAKLRITQGDALFSTYFQREVIQQYPLKHYGYRPRHRHVETKILRLMLQYYVEACNFMAQHGALDFAISVRIVQRRIELISEAAALQEIRRGLRNIWIAQPSLRDKTDVVETLLRFAKIRRVLLEYETHN